ncbi:hypothetical protein Glove_18g115 [Diversispora epigaea]|uniref:DUF659 domain-containing protein n=1 Tax=Diversispora epigaea TaxID=1348612 RepID=A0A397JSX0_9GLOM|nr:hypothetical protein Glove_18g115 [Diversispora epigaea]
MTSFIPYKNLLSILKGSFLRIGYFHLFYKLRERLESKFKKYLPSLPEAVKLFQFLNPHLKLPDRYLFGGHILNDAVEESNNTIIKILQEDPVEIILIFDITNISFKRESHIEVIKKIKETFIKLSNKKIKVCAVVTNSMRPYAISRRRLRITNRSIIFFLCFAHQINLCIGEIFKESTDQQYEEYNKYFAIVATGETRWNSYYYVCTRQYLRFILRELENFHLGIYSFNLDIWNQFSEDIYRYWSFAYASTNELEFMACRIFEICINAASME